MEHHNHDIEKAVLGRIIYDGEYLKVCDILEDRHFNAPDHREIYSAYQELFLKFKTTPDQVDIAQAVKKSSGKNILLLLNACQELAMKAWNVEEKAEMLKRLWMRRELQGLGKKLSESPQESDELVTETMNTVLNLQGTKEAKATEHVKEMAEDVIQQIELNIQYQQSGEPLPDVIYTGFPGIDQQLGGLMPGEVTIIGGRPGMGKTSFVNCVAYNVARNYPVLYFTLDMPKTAVLKDMACAYGMVEHAKLRDATLSDYEQKKLFDAIREISGMNITLNESANELGNFMLSAKRWRMMNPDGPCLIIMDYIQLVSVNGIAPGKEYSTVTHVAKAVSSMAKDLGGHIMPLAQLSRAVESTSDKRPGLHNLKESGELEQVAQNVILPYRPEYYQFETDEEGNSTQGLAEMIIAKNRNGIRNVAIKQQFIGKYKRFDEWGFPAGGNYSPVSQYTHQPAIDFGLSQNGRQDAPF